METMEQRLLFANIVVNSLADPQGFNPAITVATLGPTITLRDAANAANNTAGDDIISFDAALVASPQTIALESSLRLTDITGTTTIQGPGAKSLMLTSGTALSDFLLRIEAGATATVSGMTVRQNPAARFSRGINNLGDATLKGLAVTGWSTNATYSAGISLAIEDSAITDNHGAGSAVVAVTGTMTITNTSIGGNSAPSWSGGIGFLGTSLTIDDSTITGNSASSSASAAGGLYAGRGQVTIHNSIIAGNSHTPNSAKPVKHDIEAAGAVLSGSYNLIGDPASAGGMSDGVSGNIVGKDDGAGGRMLLPIAEVLNPLAENGGQTPTYSLASHSPAINAGSDALIPLGISTDQRGPGYARSIGSAVDMGAFESHISTTAPNDPQDGVEGSSAAFMLGSFSDESPNASWNVDVNWGDTSAHTTFTTSSEGSLGTRAHTYNDPGTFTVTVNISDALQNAQALTFTVNVSNPPVSATGGFALSANSGISTGSVTIATFTDPGGPESVDQYSASVTWGDNTGTDTTTPSIVSNANGTYSVKVSHTYATASAQPYAISVVVHHSSAPDSNIVNDTATVSPKAVVAAAVTATIKSIEGNSTGTVAVATFTDPGGAGPLSAYSATINWKDGTPASAGAITLSGGVFTVKGSHTYEDQGTYHPAIVIHRASAPDSNVVTDTAAVADAPLTGKNGVALNGVEGRLVAGTIVSFTDGNPLAPITDFKASVAWGDGITTVEKVVKDAPGKFHVVNSTHLYSRVGSFNVKATILDIGGSSTVATNIIKIVDAPLDSPGGLNLSKPVNLTFTNLTLGHFRDQDSLGVVTDFAGTIDWGDGSKSAAKFIKTGSTFNVGSFWNVQGTHKYASRKTFTVKITLHDVGTPAKNLMITTYIKVI